MADLKGVFLDLATVDHGDLDLSSLKEALPQWHFHNATNPKQIAEHIQKATVVVSNKVALDRQIIHQADDLKLICIAATGTNNVDLDAARERGVVVTNVTGYATPSVVQHVFGLILALTTRLAEHQHAISDGAWQRSEQFCLLDFPFRELSGKTLGIIGYGELGQAVARVAEAFGMQILLAQRPGGAPLPGRLPLDTLLTQADILSLHCPLTEQTHNLIGSRELALMKPDALLINTARGGIVDEEALADALGNGRLGGAGVDVLTREPPTEGNPLLAGDIPNLIVTPHIAWASRESRQRLINELTSNIHGFFHGEQRNRIT